VPHFIKIGLGCEDFQDGGHPPSWICLEANLDHPRRVLDGLYHCAKFCNNNVVVSRMWKFKYLAQMAEKRLFTPPETWDLGAI